MKNIIIVVAIIAFLFSISPFGHAQVMNWGGLTDGQKHIIHVNVGLNYGTTIGIGYGYKLNTSIPVVLNMEYSFPMGQNLVDDFKTKLGGQVQVVHAGHFATALNVNGVFRRYKSEAVALTNWGGEFSMDLGYYKPTWFVGGQIGFDKAVMTHIKNGDYLHEYYPGIQDGWYIPTGGNFFYGLQSGLSFGKSDVSLKVGKIITQDFKTTPLLPYYTELGFSHRI